MKTIGIFYGSSTGTTEGIAKRIAEKLGVEDKDIHERLMKSCYWAVPLGAPEICKMIGIVI